MDRDAALMAARDLAQKHAWPPEGFEQAVSFSGDQEVQNFVELEGGGKEELGRILKEGTYSLYKWDVRHFKEGDTHETRLRFTPKGEPYGFVVKLPEQEAGASLDQDPARSIAERTAIEDWRVDFSRYRLAESSQETRPSGRKDHTFVYERQDSRIGEGRYRLRLVVGGDKLTELTHFVQVPEAFSRRYEEMRSANTTINAVSTIAVLVLYILLCCGIGLFFMMRQRWVLWRLPLIWGLVIAALVALQQFNFWPLLWMSYDTALPRSGFVIRQVVTALAIFGGFTVVHAVSFMAAETLTRRAFPQKIQLWKIWSTPVAAAKPVLGQTLGGYLLVSIFFAYEILLYVFAHGRLGWWTPSDTLVNPDVFAAYLPSLFAMAYSAQAGFWEECLFRAVPLATAALIGDRFGVRRTFLIGAMVIQAFVFGAGHAGYANQPAYARLVELIIPSFAFGLLYLRFGLLPGIVLHYAFDFTQFSIPIFVSSAVRARFEQGLLILMLLVPLGVILAARFRSQRWGEIPAEYLNQAWQPRVAEEAASRVQVLPEYPVLSTSRASPLLPVAGLVGLVIWFAASGFRNDAPAVSVTRGEAVQQARQALAERGVQLDTSWTVLSRVQAEPGQPDRLVWQKSGRQKYTELVGTYLPPPHWYIRFARFEGEVAERAEEYQVSITGKGQVFRVRHQLPEARAGRSLTEDEARRIARDGLLARFQLKPDDLKEISAESRKRPARGDWSFEFRDTRDYGLPEGEARISVAIAGDEVVDASRYIDVPEEWARNERAQRNIPGILGNVCRVALIGIMMAGAIAGTVRWSRKQFFSVRTSFILLGASFLLAGISLVNRWPVITSQLLTAQPFMLQVAVLTALSLVLNLFIAAALGLTGGLVTGGSSPPVTFDLRKSLLVGVSVGLFMAGIGAVAEMVAISTGPQWAGFSGAANLSPFVSATLSPLNQFLTQTLTLWLIFHEIGRFSLMWKRRRLPCSVLLILAGLVLAGSSSIETIPSWLISGVVMGFVMIAAYVLVLRHSTILIPIVVGAITILEILKEGVRQAYPAAFPGSIAAAILIGIVAVVWLKALMPPAGDLAGVGRTMAARG